MEELYIVDKDQLQVEHKMFFIISIMWLHVLHINNTVKTVVLIMYH